MSQSGLTSPTKPVKFKPMKDIKIGFIGAGNMAGALLGGLRQSGVAGKQLCATDLNQSRLKQLADDLVIRTLDSNQALVDECDVVVLSVKPQVMQEVITNLNLSNPQQLFISIAAGITTSSFAKWFGQSVALVRTMPNTPAMVQSGATGLFASNQVTDEQKQIAEQIMSAVGIALWVEEESLLDTVTAVSGSGPAYFFYMMQAMEQAGIELGLSEDVAHQLTIQTALGAAKLASGSADSPEELRKKVTSPGGTTEAAINTLEASKGIELIKQAVTAANHRSVELAQKLENTP